LVLEWSTGFLSTLMALVLSHIRGTWEHSTKVTQHVCDPKQLWATTSGSNILNFYGRLGYTRLFARRPRNKQRTQKLASTRSRFPTDSTPRKVGIWKPRSEREEDAEYQRPSSGVYRRYLNIHLTTYRCVEYQRPSSGVYQKYLKILLTTYRCEVLGDAWKWAHKHRKLDVRPRRR
jgi:hypothetical protein